jgi:hypothetical protein
MKKADSTVTMIIIWLVIGLIILIVLIAMFTGKIKIFSGNIEGTCSQQGGCCLTTCGTQGNCPPDKQMKKLAMGCCPIEGVCADQTRSIGQCCLPSFD